MRDFRADSESERGPGNSGAETPDAGPAPEQDLAVGASLDMPNPKSSKSPAFQFYPKDFLSSSKVRKMSLTEIGAYTVLLLTCWLDGSLPTDLSELARTLGIKEAQLRRMWAGPLGQCFAEKNGRLINDRLERERKVQAEYRKKQKDNADRGWQSRRNATALPPVDRSHASGNALQSSSASASASTKDQERERGETPFDSVTVTDLPALDGQALFQQLHAAYPQERRHADRPTVDAFLHELGPQSEWDERFALMLVTLADHKRSEQWCRGVTPNLITWLKRGDWRGTRKLALAATGTEGRGRTGAPPKGKYAAFDGEGE